MRTLRLFPYGTCGETLPGRYSFHLPQNLGDWAESEDEGQPIQPSFLFRMMLFRNSVLSWSSQTASNFQNHSQLIFREVK